MRERRDGGKGGTRDHGGWGDGGLFDLVIATLFEQANNDHDQQQENE